MCVFLKKAVVGVTLHLFDAAGILFHGNLLYCTLKTKERFDVQTGRLFKTRPFFIFWVNLTLDNRHANFVKLPQYTMKYFKNATNYGLFIQAAFNFLQFEFQNTVDFVQI